MGNIGLCLADMVCGMSKKWWGWLLLLGLIGMVEPAMAEPEQLVVSIAPNWSAHKGVLQRYEKRRGRWEPVGKPVPALYGRNGLAWGRGLAGQEQPGRRKREGDGRAPAGRFAIGKIYTKDAALPADHRYPFHTVGQWDAWPDDPTNPYYNQHLVVDPANPPSWFKSQRMKPDDFAYRWRIEIRHNRDDIVPGAGSAIFFHIRRGPNRATAGCTTLAESDLIDLITWLDASKRPEYVLLPRDAYLQLWKAWQLPPPELVPGV